MWIVYRVAIPKYEFLSGQGVCTTYQTATKYETEERAKTAAREASERIGGNWEVAKA